MILTSQAFCGEMSYFQTVSVSFSEKNQPKSLSILHNLIIWLSKKKMLEKTQISWLAPEEPLTYGILQIQSATVF